MATEPQPQNQSIQPIRSRGSATPYYADKYKASSKRYPLDLFDPKSQYGGNMVVFYINVTEGSKLINEKTNIVTPDNNELRGAVQREALSKGAVVTTGAVLGGVTGTVLGSGAAGATVGAAGGAITTTNKTSMVRETKRLAESIALYVPYKVQSRYSMNWQEQDLAIPLGLAQASDNIADAFNAFKGSGLQAAGNVLSETIGPAAQAAAIGATGGYGDLLSSISGKAINPKKEQIFKGVDFRTFSFDYTFAPRNSAEAQQVKDIIKLFKLHMHPEYLDQESYLFLYPSEFDIYYYSGSQENMNLYRHTTCVLQEMTVDYSPNNTFSTFEDGMPTQINVNLLFRELSILTKDEIMDGF